MVVQGKDTVALCGSACVSQLLPFGDQCADSIAGSFATLGLRQKYDTLKPICVGSDREACPIKHISQVCTGLKTANQDIDALCKTPCVQTISTFFAQCSHSIQSNTMTLFSSENWSPLVELCQARGHTGLTLRPPPSSLCLSTQFHL